MATMKKHYIDAIFYLDQAMGSLEIIRHAIRKLDYQGVVYRKLLSVLNSDIDKINRLAGKMEKCRKVF